jgi:hypothetical protein
MAIKATAIPVGIIPKAIPETQIRIDLESKTTPELSTKGFIIITNPNIPRIKPIRISWFSKDLKFLKGYVAYTTLNEISSAML